MPGVGQTNKSVMNALVTGDPVKAQDLASIQGLKSYSYAEYPEVLASDKIDAVYVATPNFLHTQYVILALNRIDSARD